MLKKKTVLPRGKLYARIIRCRFRTLAYAHSVTLPDKMRFKCIPLFIYLSSEFLSVAFELAFLCGLVHILLHGRHPVLVAVALPLWFGDPDLVPACRGHPDVPIPFQVKLHVFGFQRI